MLRLPSLASVARPYTWYPPGVYLEYAQPPTRRATGWSMSPAEERRPSTTPPKTELG